MAEVKLDRVEKILQDWGKDVVAEMVAILNQTRRKNRPCKKGRSKGKASEEIPQCLERTGKKIGTFTFNIFAVFIIMSIPIKSIPLLQGEAAYNFSKKVAENNLNKHSVDFSKENSICSKILAKAKI